MKHKRKNPDASFELPDDITHRQLETYEAVNRRIISEAEEKEAGLMTSPALVGRKDAVLARAAISGGLEAGFVANGVGVPKSSDEIGDFPTKITWWMGETIATFIRVLKVIDPNSSGRQPEQEKA